MSKPVMPRADFVSALIFFVLGVFMIAAGTQMPGQEEVSYIELGGEPGRVPILLGGILAFFSLVLLIRSVRADGHRLWKGSAGSGGDRVGLVRTLGAIIGCSFYAVGLVGATLGGWKVPYIWATGVFVFLFIVAFEWELAPGIAARRWVGALEKRPGLARWLQSAFRFVTPSKAPYVWLLATALVQAVLVAVIVTYVFEKQFFVTLP